MSLNILVINDCISEGSSYQNMAGVAKHSEHHIRINVWQAKEEDLKWCDLAYVHYGGIGAWDKLLEQVKFRRDLKWILGVRGNTNFKRISFHRNRKRVMVWFSRLFDAYSCANKDIQMRLSEYDNKPCYLCTAGADPDFFKVRPKPEEFRVGWVGVYLPGIKNTDKLKELDYPIYYTHQSSLAKNDWIPHRIMPEYYKQLSVLVVPSAEEGSPMPPVEAGMMGIPTVATRVGNLEDWMPDELLIPRDFQPKEMNEILHKLETDPTFYDLCSSLCYQGAMRYTFENVAKQYDEMFTDVYKEG